MRRALVGVFAVGVVFVAVVGVLHAPPFRALLYRAPCPVGGDQAATPRQREATRLAALEPRRGTQPAPVREAFGFTLGQSNAAALAAWRAEAGAQCKVERAGLVEECETQALTRFGSSSPGTVFFRADDAGRLVAMLVTTRLPDAQAAELKSSWADTLEVSLGQPQVARGLAGPSLLSQERREHHFSDLLASVSVTQMGEGMRVNLELQSLTARD